jgi:hypothetical protein
MNQTTQHSAAWVTFTYISFAASAFMVGIGIWLLPLDLAIKAERLLMEVSRAA